ncbi:hypothetical protein [Marisediminicola senii]|uniref:hypothetical protein n=1 Tax=Marisediminicola senii TaxID=2711233 RepID=UPI0013EDD274|nr:hypothetical protein [Marisediminicola senii]
MNQANPDPVNRPTPHPARTPDPLSRPNAYNPPPDDHAYHLPLTSFHDHITIADWSVTGHTAITVHDATSTAGATAVLNPTELHALAEELSKRADRIDGEPIMTQHHRFEHWTAAFRRIAEEVEAEMPEATDREQYLAYRARCQQWKRERSLR